MSYKKLTLLVLITAIWLVNPSLVQGAPSISARSYCLVDRATGQIIYGKNVGLKVPMASTTKMMTAILAVEYADLNETAVVSSNADKTAEYTIGLRTGQKMSVEELMKAALIRSANDSAVVLAEHIAGDEQFFAYLMSKKAFAIGAMQTRFKNASGLPAEEHYSTAYDLALIGRYALSEAFIAKTVATRTTEFKHPGYQQLLTINNTNIGFLTSYAGADGIKTGTTDDAGKCLVASATRKDRGLIAVVLKSSDRAGDAIRLLDYGFQETEQQKFLDQAEGFKSLNVSYSDESRVDVIPQEDLWLWLGKAPNIEKKVSLNYNLNAPLKKGEVLGRVDIYTDGIFYKSVALICQKDISRQSAWLSRLIKHIITMAGIDDGS